MSVSEEQVILIVEDNEDDLVLFRRSALRAGLECKAFWLDHPDRVMAYLGGSQEFHDRTTYPLPSLIFLSDYLQKKSTLDLLACLAREPAFNQIPVVVLSTHLPPDFCTLALTRGALECFWETTFRFRMANAGGTPSLSRVAFPFCSPLKACNLAFQFRGLCELPTGPRACE